MNRRPKVAIFVHQPACSVDSSNGIISALDPEFSFKLFSKDEVESTFFNDVDLICVPGGIGDADRFDVLMKYNTAAIKKYVKQGGKYLGICMGAYWAGPHYFNILDNISPVQYIKRPNADTRRPHAKAQKVIWAGQEQRMFFYDGCSLIGKGISSSQIWSLYPNGDPMAVIQNNIGLIGCHPESSKHWYDEYTWMPKHWHNGLHHKLLLNFVKSLIHGR